MGQVPSFLTKLGPPNSNLITASHLRRGKSCRPLFISAILIPVAQAVNNIAAMDEPSRLAAWTEFHQRIGDLPTESREAFDLLWYQGLTQAEAAYLLGVTERTVQGRWQQARIEVHKAMRGSLPGVV